MVTAGNLIRLSLILAVLIACSPSRPKIVQTFSQLNYVWEKDWEAPTEALSVFVQVENEDGLEELQHLYVLHDDLEVYWKLDPETWTPLNRPGENWIGANQLTIPQRTELPRGKYRILVTTQAGERETSNFSLDVELLSEAKPVWPQLAVVGRELLISNAPASYALWFYGIEGPMLHQMVANEQRLTLEQIQAHPQINQRATRVWFYWYNEKQGWGQILGPFPLITGDTE